MKDEERFIFRPRNELEEEYGCTENVRFFDPENVTMYDTGGKVMYCKCGEKAGMAIIGREACLAMCSKCAYGE